MLSTQNVQIDINTLKCKQMNKDMYFLKEKLIKNSVGKPMTVVQSSCLVVHTSIRVCQAHLEMRPDNGCRDCALFSNSN